MALKQFSIISRHRSPFTVTVPGDTLYVLKGMEKEHEANKGTILLLAINRFETQDRSEDLHYSGSSRREYYVRVFFKWKD